MKIASKLLLGLAILQGVAYGADEPRIEVIDGKISITAQAVPLGRFLGLFDKAMGLKSEVKPGLENRNISVQLAGLNFNDAVRKIFQGQPFNYVVIQGKGIRVTDLVVQGSASDSQSFAPAPQSFSNPVNMTIQPFQPNPINNPQPAATSIFGGPAPAPVNPAINPSTPLSGPGVMPPPIGFNNPLTNPAGGPNSGGNVIALPGTGNPAPAQPAAPGTLPGAIPGAAPGTIK